MAKRLRFPGETLVSQTHISRFDHLQDSKGNVQEYRRVCKQLRRNFKGLRQWPHVYGKIIPPTILPDDE